MSHERLVKDASLALGTCEHSVFVKALVERRGLACSHIVDTATNIYTEFRATGCVPQFVQDFCLSAIQARKRVLARRQAEMQVAKIQDPNVSMVDAPSDRCPEQVGQTKFFEDDMA